jgi:signal transduction histidine kinase/ABC-type branched-subunit amino acid transport system ATPase component
MESLFQNNPRELLRLNGVSLDYGQFRALKQIDFIMEYAEAHAVVGEHGAGKSSFGMVVSGMLKPQSGQIVVEGRSYRGLTLPTAQKIGIEMVHQNIFSLNERFTVAENLFLTMPSSKKLPWKYDVWQAAKSLFAQYDIDMDPMIPVQQLNLSERTLVDILKHLHARPRLLILDEALEKLSAAALPKVVEILMQSKHSGMSILFITHRIDDIYKFADKVSIIKNGEILLTDEVKNIDKINLIKMAYIQISSEPSAEGPNQEFYQLLKYNEAILRNLPVNLIVTDNENRIKLVNEYCKQSFRLEKTTYLNSPFSQVVFSQSDDVRDLINQAFAGHEEKTFYQVPLKFNQMRLIGDLKICPIYDGTFLIGYIIILEDVTEYDQLQKQVVLSEKLASVGLLAAGVAHEINNPLGIICNYLSYIKYRFTDPALHEAIDNVQEEITSISGIVGNLHSFSDNKALTLEELGVNDLIGDMLKLLQHNARYKHIAIVFTPCPHELVIRANKNEIKQVILNLLKNSFEAMPSGGEISIATAGIAEDGQTLAQITFKDTGPGIGDDNPSNIFLPFYSTKKGQDNMGLGLSVSYGIIKKYNGTISVKNLENAGCQFIIQIPQSS